MTDSKKIKYFLNFQDWNLDGLEPAPGNKFTNLARIHKYFNVPNALCLTSDFFYESLNRQKEFYNHIKDYFSELQATYSCFLIDSIKKLEDEIAKFTIPNELKNQLNESITGTFGDFSSLTFAVRSSAKHEDSENHSFAGIYDSFLDVGGFDNIVEAVINVWKSYYNYSAIVARIRSNNYDPFPGINVIIQCMVKSHISGVAFSKSPWSSGSETDTNDSLIEWVNGPGEKLVSGKEEVNVYSPHCQNNDLDPILTKKLNDVYLVIPKLKEFFNYDIDVEWAWDHEKLYILQVRPITTLKNKHLVKEPFVNIHNLYFNNRLKEGQDVNLGKCEDIYRLYVTKRSPAYILASQNNVTTGLSLFLQFNKRGIEEKFTEIENKLKQSEIDKIIIDIDNSIRQIIITKPGLYDYLSETFKNCDPTEDHTMILRDFVSGEYGFISQLLPRNRLLIEASSQGLMAINRGLANCSEIICQYDENHEIISIQPSAAGDNVLTEHFVPGNIQTIIKFTSIMNNSFPNVKLEWVLRKKIPYFIDYSTEKSNWDYTGEIKNNHRIIYGGVADGPLYFLDNKESLTRLSISPGVSVSHIDHNLKSNEELFKLIAEIKNLEKKPIIVSKRPYAVLSYLLDDTAGFIFEGGSLLCHLSILIRESRIPSLICSNISEILQGKKSAIISFESIIGGN